MVYDVAIVGMGPAGLQAALYTCRAGLSTIVIGKDGGALSKASMIENFFGQKEPVCGGELLENTKKQASRLGAVLIEDEIFHIDWTGGFELTGKTDSYSAVCVLLATGSQRKSAGIDGLERLEGHGVSYCAVCDAFFYRGRKIAVLGWADYALSELSHLVPVASEAVLLTDGKEITAEFPSEVKIFSGEIKSIDGADRVEGVSFKDGTRLSTDAVFVALGSAGALDLARKVGALTEGRSIVTDDEMATNVPGLYAAGDCTGGLLQISKAVGEGAKAAMAMIKFVRQSKKA